MTAETSLIPDEARAMIGRETGRASGRVVKQEFQRWAAAVKDRNPLYFDAGFARAHGYRDVVAPPLYVQYVTLGVTDLTTLIGYYTTVSLTLAAYNVPADAVGLKR